MTTTGTSSSDREALALFEEFLERYHDEGADFEEFVITHVLHAQRLRRWWQHLVAVGEIPASPVLAPSFELSEDTSFGAYRLERVLGRGSQGVVYEAVDRELGRRVALKLLPRYRAIGGMADARFAREAELASRLDDPGICTIYERGMRGDTAFIAMRLVEGETLAAQIARTRRLVDSGAATRTARFEDPGSVPRTEAQAIRAVLELFEQVARTLHVAHGARLIHRDVKPGNIMCTRDHRAVLLDFGLARDLENEAALTLTGDLVGTPAYMSPEQLTGNRIQLDGRSDVYSLATSLFECLTLSRPFEAASRDELYQQILSKPAPSARALNGDVSNDLDLVVRTALEKDRERRYSSAAEFADDLARVRNHEPIKARAPSASTRVFRWAQRKPGLATALAVLFVGLVAGLYVSLSLYARARDANQRSEQLFARLFDGALLDRAVVEARGLRPIEPEREGEISAWLERFAVPLRSRLVEHRAALDALRARAHSDTTHETDARKVLDLEIDRLRSELAVFRSSPLFDAADRTDVLDVLTRGIRQRLEQVEDEANKLRVYRFESARDQLGHDALVKLVDRLERFDAPDGLAKRMEAHLLWTRSVVDRTVAQYRAEWNAACRTVASDPIYDGCTIEPTPGLVPLGTNTAGLLEFVDLRSGSVPERDAKSERLRVTADSGIVFVLLPPTTIEVRALGTSSIQLDPFCISKYELSRAQWVRLGGELPLTASCASDDAAAALLPIDNVSWLDAVEVFSEYGLTLPSEAQWEYAARARTTTQWWWGNGPPKTQPLDVGNFADKSLALFRRRRQADRLMFDDGYALLAPIDRYRASPYGLYNLYGNVAEWCLEPFRLGMPPSQFKPMPKTGELLVPRNDLRTARGGSYLDRVAQSNATTRVGRRDAVGRLGLGFRPVRTLRTSPR